MPLVKTVVSVDVDENLKDEVVKELSRITATSIGKPEVYVASVLECGVAITFGGERKPGAFIEVKSIGGLNSSVNNTLAKEICECMQSKLGIEPSAVYINFTDVSASDWGYNGSTFG
jgi:phenylpyruvate tautomerase